MTERETLAAQVQDVGEKVNALRIALVNAKMSFTAGVVRGVEEALMLTKTMLEDQEVKQEDL